MKKVLLSICVFACLQLTAVAGHFTLVTSNQYFHYPANAWPPMTCTSTPTVFGKTYSLKLDVKPFKPWVSVSLNGFSFAYVDVYMKLQWHPGPGDPVIPPTDSSYWSVSQSATCQLLGLLTNPTSASVAVIGTFVQDPNNYNFNQVFTDNSLNYPLATTHNVPHNTFTYFTQGGIVYGESVFRISLEVSGVGNIPAPEKGGVWAELYESKTLTSVGSYPVL